MSGKRRAGLTKDAVPSIFNGAPGYLSKKIKSPRKKAIRRTCGELTRTFTRGIRCEEATEQETHPRSLAENAVPEQPEQSACANEVGDTTEAHVSTLSVFDRLFASAASICLPSSSWAVHRIDSDGFKDVLFNDASVPRNSSDGPGVPFNRKSVHIKSDMTVQLFILGKPIQPTDVGISPLATSVFEVEDMVRAVANLDVCSGGPSLKDFPNVTPQCVYIDCERKWRHNKCPLVSPGNAICRSCRALVNTLKIHNDRRIARAQQRQPPKHIRISVLPDQKEKLDALRKAKSALQRSRARLMKRNELLARQLQNMRQELMKLQEKKSERSSEGLTFHQCSLFSWKSVSLLLEQQARRTEGTPTGCCCAF
ncbi:hypothetical protein HPB50_012874 [Hyalomma asiaticum]|uniref:Uncharacterized protein n=1 Tax=Hyalomma asiaticum TaxID=266040 RepID=A0ACB7THC7_HYAAI|nr:hypothetical protein HPB50_012874 [Hyalomma asiaticum]